MNSILLSYSYDSDNLDYDLSLNFAEINGFWAYDLTFDRSYEFANEDSYDLKVRYVYEEDDTFLYAGASYYFNRYSTEFEVGLTSDLDSGLYLSAGSRMEYVSGVYDLSWGFGFPLAEGGVINQGRGPDTDERFFQINVGSSECRTLKELCWRGSFQEIGEERSIGFGGFIEF